MNKSESIKELAGALSKAQGEMPFAPMDATNPFLKNRYADLGSIIKTAKPVLSKYGLSVSQQVETDDTHVGVTTVLMHQSGEWIESSASLPMGDEKGKSQAQVAGSIVTYLRRYSYAAALGMYADEDNDGNGPQTQARPAKPVLRTIADEAVELGGVVLDAPTTKMDLATAEAVTNSKGQAYGEIISKNLTFMAGNIRKSIDHVDTTPEQREEYRFKLDAILTILAARSEKAA